MCCHLIPVLPESLSSSQGSQGVENQLSLCLLSLLQVEELEEGAVWKSQKHRSCLVDLVWDMGTRALSR